MELLVLVRDVLLAVVEARPPHQRLPHRRVRPVATQDEVGVRDLGLLGETLTAEIIL